MATWDTEFAFPMRFRKTPLKTQKARRKRDSRFRPHFGEKISNGTLGNVICVSIRKFRFLIYRRDFFGNAQNVSETSRAFPQFVAGKTFGNAPNVFNAFLLRFRAFGNALSVSIAFPLRFLFRAARKR